MEEALAFALHGERSISHESAGRGHLFRKSYEALCYTRDFPYKDSVCVGVKNKAELDFACGVLCSDITPESGKLGSSYQGQSQALGGGTLVSRVRQV